MIVRNIKRISKWQKGHNNLTFIEKVWINALSFHNIRDMNHFTKQEKYFDKDYHLQNLIWINLISVPFWYKNLISHIMLEFLFSDSSPLILSVEARRKEWEELSIFRGLFPWYGIIYIWGTAEDLVWLRTFIRKKEVLSLPLKITKQESKKILLSAVERTNSLKNHPEYFHTIFSNCSNNTFRILKRNINKFPKYSVYYLLNGLIHKFLDKKWIIHSTPL